jgi:alkylation response protein AidB-like acyl-CoA dehydrogenase
VEVTLSEDQRFFRETTQKFLDDKSPVPTVRSFRHHDDGFERDYWRQGAELGWVSLLVPEEHGGGSISGSGVVDVTLVADAFGSHTAPGPLLPSNIVAAALARSGSDAQRTETLPGVIAGEIVPAWVVGPPAGDTVSTGITATAATSQEDGGGYVLEGMQGPVEAAVQADLLLVTARLDDGLAQFLVAPDAPGVTVTRLDSIDLTRRYGRVQLDGVRVGADAAVGTPGGAAADVERQVQLAVVIQTAEMVGAAQVVFDFTLEWMFDRYSFGRPLASYQNLKHRFADMKMWLEASHAMAAAAARAVQDETSEAAALASMAKAYTAQYLPELVQDCVQMHGGIGVTYEHDIHLYLRRVTVDAVTHGSASDHRQRIVALKEREQLKEVAA